MEHVIGLISDTHGLVRPEVFDAFTGVEMILHAGDVGGHEVLEALAAIAPVKAVYGNVDDPADPALARERTEVVGGVIIHVSHGHEIGRPTAELVLSRYKGDVIVFGHTHRAVLVRNDDGRVGVNPGAAGPRRFDIRPSVARLILRSGAAEIEFVPL
jgi:putative phosphoesterase